MAEKDDYLVDILVDLAFVTSEKVAELRTEAHAAGVGLVDLMLANKLIRVAAPDQEKATVDLRAGKNDLLVKIVNGGGAYAFYFRVLEMGLPADVAGILKAAPELALFAALFAAEVNVHFTYPLLMRPHEQAALALHVDDNDCAMSVLIGAGFQMLSQGDISR